MAFDWRSIIGTVAPTVATALLGPLGGAAISAIGSIIGISEPTQEKIAEAIQTGQLKPEQIAQLKALELQYQNEEKERGFKYAELEFKDRDSARQRETATGDKTNRVLAFTIVGSFIAVVGCTLLGFASVDSALAGTLVGYISAKAEQVLAYYFGSSKGSSEKTALLAQAQPIKPS
jgi:hypothetical protein